MNTTLAKIGFEIEGEWTAEAMEATKSKFGGVYKDDGSIRHCDGSSECRALVRKEYNSTATVATDVKQLKVFFEELHKQYKSGKFHFNKTCGFHIHVSFNPANPTEIFSRQFVNFFLKNLRERQKEVLEMRKGNRFCKVTIPTHEITDRNCDERYRFINLWPAFRRHGTIEFRIYPANTPKKMYRYILFTLTKINQFLNQPITLRASTTIEIGGVHQEEFHAGATLKREVINLDRSRPRRRIDLPF